MKTSRKTAGVTLVFTVLIVMLLLAGVVVVTAQLAISARRSSDDQNATIQAQYVAESGVARAQARLNLINDLMAQWLQPAATVKTTEMATLMLNLCGVASPTAAQLALPAGITLTTPVLLCSSTAPGGLLSTVTNLTNSVNLNFFTSNIPDTAYTTNGYSLGTDPTQTERTFWAQSLVAAGTPITGKIGGSASDNVQSAVGIALQKVERFGVDSYRLTFTVPDVVSSSTTAGAVRSLSVAGVSNTYSYEVSRGSFAKYALFTNNHVVSQAADTACQTNPTTCSRITFTSNTLFSGPVHTNQNFLIQGSPYFSGLVESSGCSAGNANDGSGNPAQTCGSSTLTPGAYISNGNGTNNLIAPANIAGNTPSLCYSPTNCPSATNPVNPVRATPQFQGGVNWTAPFQPLPTNSNDQATAAATGGLLLSGTVSALKLSVGSVTPAGTSIAKPVQLIDYTQTLNGTTVSTSTQLAVSADKVVYVNAGTSAAPIWKPGRQLTSGLWVDASLALPVGQSVTATSFNGVIYAPSGITSLKGPARTTPDDPSTAPPALASFSQITVASASDIHIKNDLKYQDPPCNGSNSLSTSTPPVFTAAACPTLNATNILGIYSSGGDIAIDSSANTGAGYGPVNGSNGAGKDVTIQAVLMASKKSVKVDGFDQGTGDANILGKVNLLGGIIENYYGAFGITDGHGFGRNYVYDPRMGDGYAPPAFPTQQTWDTNFKKTTDTSGASIKTPLKLDGSQTQQPKTQ
ncbi:DUF4900 domain-containing protein [Deinococcus altitudinis]|uniref:DUF4900 domain-containing protein n=1 Tax=Deinococcus altitudinis TaxID=468914 RepID=UPI003891EB86